MPMRTEQSFVIAETLSGDLAEGLINLVVETIDNRLIGLSMNRLTAGTLARFLGDLVEKWETAATPEMKG